MPQVNNINAAPLSLTPPWPHASARSELKRMLPTSHSLTSELVTCQRAAKVKTSAAREELKELRTELKQLVALLGAAPAAPGAPATPAAQAQQQQQQLDDTDPFKVC